MCYNDNIILFTNAGGVMKFNISINRLCGRKVNKKLNLIFKSAFLITAFIFLGNLIAAQSGITNQFSKIFYWPEERGSVAGEFTMRMAQTKTHPFVIVDQADFDVIKQRIQNNEQPWRKQYDLLMSQAAVLVSAPGSGY